MLAFVLGEVLAVIQFNIVFLCILLVSTILIRIITKKKVEFFVVIFLFAILGELISGEEIKNRNEMYSYKNSYTEISGGVNKISETANGINLFLSDVTLYGKKYKKILVLYKDSVNVKIGQKVLIKGQFKQLNENRNEGNFDAKFYYMTMGIYGEMEGNTIEIIDYKFDIIRQSLVDFKKRVKNNLNLMCSDMLETGIVYKDKAPMFSGVLLGDKSDMDTDIKDLYQASGIAHILAISGLHISFIGIFLYNLMRKKFRFTVSAVVSLIIVLLFSIMCGMGIATVRAVVMFALRLIGEVLGRTYDYLTAISTAGIMLMLGCPFVILNTGFQMSFVAIISITIVLPVVKRVVNIRNKIANLIIGSITITIIMMPIISYNYFQLPTFSFLINLLIIPLMNVVIMSGVAGIIGSFINITLGKILLFPGCLIWDIYTFICNAISKIPYSNIIVGKTEIWKICIYYSLIIVVLFACNYIKSKREKRSKKLEKTVTKDGKIIISKNEIKRKINKENRKYKIAISILTMVLIVLIYVKIPSGFYVSFLDVSQGDGIFIHTDNGINVTIDGGSTTMEKVGKYRIIPYLKSKGIEKIDYAIITHSDKDHVSGLSEMIEMSKNMDSLQINNLVLPNIGTEDENYINLKKIAKQNNINILYIEKGDTLKLGNTMFTCISPEKGFTTENANDYSTVLDVRYKSLSMFLTGDISSEIEEQILSSSSDLLGNKYTILKVAHHGSKYSTSGKWLNKIKPNLAIISVGENNSYGHPTKETLHRLKTSNAQILRTDKVGEITIKVSGEKNSYSTYIDNTQLP